jgi:hypothetical protein
MRRSEAKRLIIKLHKLGIVSIIHGKLRLGAPGLYFDLLTPENKKLLLT